MRFISIACILLLSSCYVGQELAPDQDVWEYAQPNEVGLSSEILLDLNNRIKLNEFQEINGLIIIKNDRLVFENYYERYLDSFEQVFRKTDLNRRNEVMNLSSAGMTFTLAAVGVADDKRIISIEDPIMDYLPGYEQIFEDDPDKQNITVAHLMSHRSGFSWNESIQPFSLTNDLNLMKSTDDWIKYVLEQPLEAPPGLRFNLNTGSGILLAKIIETASGQSFETFLEENILTPLSITTLTIDTDEQGNFNGGDGISVSLLDWTKLGYLFLKEGIWENRKILDPNFVNNATSMQSVVSGTYNMGHIWWLFGENFSDSFGIAHDDIIYIPGELGQHMYIIPSENMIVSIFAANYFLRFQNPSLNLFAEITYSFQ
ncbi:serine hydrolase domain-containing protein [Ekhidna sp.]|uniref:serine hydrolase domain-containing protein n=1 Tax=Ekhidna sp. TaxID=2608089 RepID=UPI0035177234